jgi:hypothetical protein
MRVVSVMHKFKIGQQLFPARSVGLNVPDGAYVIVKRLPERDGELQYQIKSVANPDERVVGERSRSGPLWVNIESAHVRVMSALPPIAEHLRPPKKKGTGTIVGPPSSH